MRTWISDIRHPPPSSPGVDMTREFRVLASIVFGLAVAAPAHAQQQKAQAAATPQVRELRIPVGDTSLYARTIGTGPPVIVLHGGPDFDSAYLLPELDRLSDRFQLIYYDQRGRG